MTTTTTVTTYDWPTSVTRVNPDTLEPIVAAERVEPHSQSIFYVSDHQALLVKELPRADAPAAALAA